MNGRLVAFLGMIVLAACASRATTTTASSSRERVAAETPAPTTSPSPPTPPAPRVSRVELGEGVTVAIHAGTLGEGVSGWTLVTHGLARTQEHELVLAVAARQAEAPDEPPQQAVDLLRDLATGGRPGLDAWTVVDWVGGTFGRADLDGILAIPAASTMPDVELPPGALSLLVVTSDELATARLYGVPRVAAMLAHHHGDARATWVDRDRQAMLTAQQIKRSGWWASLPTPLRGVTARLDVDGQPAEERRSGRILGSHTLSLDATWIVRVTPEGAADLAERLRHLSRVFKGASIRPDPDAGARFVWRPEVDGFELLVTRPSHTQPTVSLIGFGAARSAHGAQLSEDGLAIYLSYAQRDAIVAALTSGTEVTIEAPTAGLMPWRLEWARP